MKTTEPPIILTEYYDAPIARLWNSLTVLEEMQQWYFKEIEQFKPIEGFATQFTFGTEGKLFTTNWKITQLIPNELIRYTWNYVHYKGDSEVCFTLSEEEGKTKLLFEVTIIEDFPCDKQVFTRESALVGWKYVLGEALRNYLDGELIT